jgi:hypothetical protein
MTGARVIDGKALAERIKRETAAGVPLTMCATALEQWYSLCS